MQPTAALWLQHNIPDPLPTVCERKMLEALEIRQFQGPMISACSLLEAAL